MFGKVGAVEMRDPQDGFVGVLEVVFADQPPDGFGDYPAHDILRVNYPACNFLNFEIF